MTKLSNPFQNIDPEKAEKIVGETACAAIDLIGKRIIEEMPGDDRAITVTIARAVMIAEVLWSLARSAEAATKELTRLLDAVLSAAEANGLTEAQSQMARAAANVIAHRSDAFGSNGVPVAHYATLRGLAESLDQQYDQWLDGTLDLATETRTRQLLRAALTAIRADEASKNASMASTPQKTATEPRGAS